MKGLEHRQGQLHALSMFEGSLVDADVIINRLQRNIDVHPCAKFASGMQETIDRAKALTAKVRK